MRPAMLFLTVWILGYPVGAQFRTVERPAEGLAAVRLDAWAQGRADASLPALVLHPNFGLHADGAAPYRPPHARERLRGGFDVWGDDGDADDAERGDAVVEKRGEMRAHLGFSVHQCWPASGEYARRAGIANLRQVTDPLATCKPASATAREIREAARKAAAAAASFKAAAAGGREREGGREGGRKGGGEAGTSKNGGGSSPPTTVRASVSPTEPESAPESTPEVDMEEALAQLMARQKIQVGGGGARTAQKNGAAAQRKEGEGDGTAEGADDAEEGLGAEKDDEEEEEEEEEDHDGCDYVIYIHTFIHVCVCVCVCVYVCVCVCV